MITTIEESASARRGAFARFDFDFLRRSVINIATAPQSNGALPGLPEVHKSSHSEAASAGKGVSCEDNFEGIIGRSTAISALRKELRPMPARSFWEKREPERNSLHERSII